MICEMHCELKAANNELNEPNGEVKVNEVKRKENGIN